MNAPHAALEAALRLAGRDAGFEALTLGDWAALREAARRDMAGDGEDEVEVEREADARFVARTFGAGRGRGRRGRGLAAVLGVGGGGGSGRRGEEEAASLTRSVPYDDFVRALQGPGACSCCVCICGRSKGPRKTAWTSVLTYKPN